jgi:hypothetical protein
MRDDAFVLVPLDDDPVAAATAPGAEATLACGDGEVVPCVYPLAGEVLPCAAHGRFAWCIGDSTATARCFPRDFSDRVASTAITLLERDLGFLYSSWIVAVVGPPVACVDLKVLACVTEVLEDSDVGEATMVSIIDGLAGRTLDLVTVGVWASFGFCAIDTR